ncbi:hypothetical protein K493DRAFT_346023 [Basidiobolus meristosporus CBS 931.73]|uniref:CsbD-like domain-containing protein n=1 Tax=Basidiobolus meristosporus CBS 931.73 TaxID=1314790 RepID=A0A1Y1Z0A5_9FUNG|nr:hypothetical protein K493DRAFT_346023 [Basidiobolus meristosporus CBS 931.73]|eukprot:ORY03722.1 hypothetical protein K493DRAFT_346023 [Basidiobolus meristosporus CBS 931.73]
MTSTNKEGPSGNTLAGLRDTVSGKAKEEIGELTGNPEMGGVGSYEKQLGQQELAAPDGPRLRKGLGTGGPNESADQTKRTVEDDQEIDVARASEYAEGAGTKVAGIIESVVGSIIGDESLKDQGESKKIEGELQMRNA